MTKAQISIVIGLFIISLMGFFLYQKHLYSSALENFPAPENFYEIDRRVTMIGSDGSWAIKDFKTIDKEIDFKGILDFYENWAKENDYTIQSRNEGKVERHVRMPTISLKNKIFNRVVISIEIHAPKISVEGLSWEREPYILNDENVMEYIVNQSIPESEDYFWTIKIFAKK